MHIETVRDGIDALAQSQPDAAFLIGPETNSRVTCAMLRGEAIRLSAMLHRAGLQKGDKAAFLLDNGLLYSLLFLGSMYGGYVAVPLNVRAGVAQLSYMVDHCDAKILFVENQYTDLLKEALQGVRRDIRVLVLDPDAAQLPAFETDTADSNLWPLTADDPSLLMYSSGSTGKPKGAIHTHASILAHGRNSIEAHRLTVEDRSLLVLPLYHINAECVTLIPTLLSSGSVVVPHRFVVSKFWDWIEDYRVTWSALVPTIILDLVNWNDSRSDARQEAFQRIRFLRSSSAPLAPSLHRQFIDKFNLPLLQAMGSTEGGNVFSNPVPPGQNKIGSPGLPWGFETRIVDREGTEVPVGQPGEVLLRGTGLMKGYYKDPEGTAAVVDGDGWLHTGDLARKDEDGYFFVVGRAKELIIKGGVNIAPRAIDEVLESHPAVLEAAAVGVPDPYFGEDAVAFVVRRVGSIDTETDLLSFCESRLGHFKTPSRIHFIKELPKGPSGKVQRLRLLDPGVLSAVAQTTQHERAASTTSGDTGRNLPSSECTIEPIIAAAWGESLGMTHVDLDTNFFALGGDSLAAIRCLSKLRGKLPVVLSITDFFAGGTVNGQAELVKRRLRSANGEQDAAGNSQSVEQSLLEDSVSKSEQVIPHIESAEPYPLSPAQQRLWFMEQLNPDVPVYNESEAVRLTGELNVNALERALNMIVERYAVLRSTITVTNEVPHAIIHKSWPLRFKKIDLSTLSAAERESEVQRLLIDEPRVHYNLQAEPGFRVTLLYLGPREHVLMLMMHHIVCDWSSIGVFWRVLSTLYRSLVLWEAIELPPLSITHRDHAIWKQQSLTNGDMSDHLAFWEKTLHGVPQLLELPSDRSRPAIMSYRGSRLRWKLNSALTEALRRTSRKEKASLFTVFAAALNALVYRYTGNGDIPLGIPLADRDFPEQQSLIGFLLHVHVLRTRLAGEMTFNELLSRVQSEVLDLYTHRAAPFDQIVQKLHPERNPSYTPIFQVMLTWRDRDQHPAFIGLEGLTVESLMSASGTSKFDLNLFATDTGDEVWLELEYNSDLFDDDRCLRMLAHYQSLLEGVAANSGTRLDKLPLLTARERQQILVEWNKTEARFPRRVRLHELFEQQVAKTPSAVALVFENQQLTYEDLNQRANQLAHYLRRMGAEPDTLVGVCMERSVEMVVALYAVLKAGAAYVPIDPEYPPERVAFMLQDAKPSVLLTQAHLASSLPRHDGRLFCVDGEWDQVAQEATSNPVTDVGPNHLAYMIYTSGSTGRPKGALNTHGGVCNRLLWMQDRFGLKETDRILQKTPFSFDVSVWEFFWPLLAGARLVMASPGGHRDPSYLVRLIIREQITVMHFVPSMLRAFLAEPGVGECRSLRHVICSGEALPFDLQGQFFGILLAELHNLYGPTEAAVDVSHWTCERNGQRQIVPIGRPVANTQLYILDRNLQPVPIGVPGELYIGGIQVGRGYHNRPELTAERFIPDPFGGAKDARLYKTGDLCRWLSDGVIEFLGRLDFQVKMRGFRIELGEIEAQLSEQAGITEAVVVVREDTPGDRRLVAYYTGNDGLSMEQLRSQLSAKLPEYMLPAAFVKLESMPRTPNGKWDRKALPTPEIGAFATRAYEAPIGEIESALATIWRELLMVEQVGRRDNFFDLGGHSLIAMKVISKINSQFEVHLLIGDLFRAQTLAELGARVLETRAASTKSSVGKWDALIPIQTQGSRAPLFCVARPNVNALGFVALSRALGNDQPVFGLQSQMEFASDFRDEQYRMAAEEYIRALKSIQLHGPYHLVGQCQGSYIAFEMVRQLESAGEEVSFLGILDTWAEENTRTRWKFYLDQRAKAMLQLYRPSRLARALRKASARAMSVLITTNPVIPRSGQKSMQEKYWPGADFVAPACQARLVVLRVRNQSWFRIADEALGWRNRSRSGVTCVLIPGEHQTFLRQPHVQEVAATISHWMESSRTMSDPALVEEAVGLAP